MAPHRTRKRKSSSEDASLDHAPRPQKVMIQSPTRTPVGSPMKKTIMITQGQKQALIDNLQLEVTERARKLRAQYTLQAQSLRTRIELRINRIPASLRKASMGDLYTKYTNMQRKDQNSKPADSLTEKSATTELPKEALFVEPSTQETKSVQTVARPRLRGVKRKSDVFDIADKENVPNPMQPLPNPKKRTKGATATTRQGHIPSTVLSPKSSNSRTLPQSPIRPPAGSPQKSYSTHPASPLKPLSPVKMALPSAKPVAVGCSDSTEIKPRTTRTRAAVGRKPTNPQTTAKPATSRAKRGETKVLDESGTRTVSNSSNMSTVSSGTTVIKKAGKIPAAAAAAAVAAAAKRTVGASIAGRRVLRKRA